LQSEEVKISLGGGDFHLAGKFWGDKSKRPILCLHGAQDNAGSFDRLIPLLPDEHSYLAVDIFGKIQKKNFASNLLKFKKVVFLILNNFLKIHLLRSRLKLDIPKRNAVQCFKLFSSHKRLEGALKS
jgi:hypothetical protein